MLENIIIVAVVLIIVGAASLYIYKAKKNGNKCIGCSAGKSCKSCNCGCSEQKK